MEINLETQLDPLEPQPTSTQKPKTSKKLLLIGVLLLILVVATAFVTWLTWDKDNIWPNTNSSSSGLVLNDIDYPLPAECLSIMNTKHVSPVFVPQECIPFFISEKTPFLDSDQAGGYDIYTDLVDYKNTKYGFQFKYPPEWSPYFSETNINNQFVPDISAESDVFTIMPRSLTMSECGTGNISLFLKGEKDENVQRMRETYKYLGKQEVVGSISGKTLVWDVYKIPDDFYCDSRIFLIENNGFVYHLLATPDDESIYETNFDQTLLNSFEFIDIVESDKNLYLNHQYGFKFPIPDDWSYNSYPDVDTDENNQIVEFYSPDNKIVTVGIFNYSLQESKTMYNLGQSESSNEVPWAIKQVSINGQIWEHYYKDYSSRFVEGDQFIFELFGFLEMVKDTRRGNGGENSKLLEYYSSYYPNLYLTERNGKTYVISVNAALGDYNGYCHEYIFGNKLSGSCYEDGYLPIHQAIQGFVFTD